MPHSSSKVVKMENIKKYSIPEYGCDEKYAEFAHIDTLAISSMIKRYLIQEDKLYLETVKMVFEQSWNEINLGERIIEDYIKFCITKKDFSFEFVHLVNKQMRYKYI